MAVVALARLFRDIARLPDDERSPYERAIHRELAMLGIGPAPDGAVGTTATDDTAGAAPLEWSDINPDRVRTGVDDLRLLMGVDADRSAGPDPQDIRRLSCSCATCPAKRL